MHDTRDTPGRMHAGRLGDGADDWHNWEWLMNSVTHSLWG
jgi:hypothetical protein